MDLNAIPCVAFEQVMQELDNLRQVSFSEAEQILNRARVTTTHAALVAEYAPQYLGEICGVSLLADSGTDMTPLEKEVYDVLSNLFPCNVDLLFQEILEGDGVPGLLIDPVFNVSSEMFSEMCDDPEQFGDGELCSLLTFVRYLALFVDAFYLQRAAEHFGWSTDAPECVTTAESIDSVDMVRFYALLEEHSLGEFKLAFQCTAQETDNIFLDWTLDEVYNEYIPYIMASIRDLADEWASAQPRVEELKAAAARFKKDRWISSRIIGLWDQCVSYKDGRVPRTLVELWGGEEVEVVEDEFYGPIGIDVEAEDDD